MWRFLKACSALVVLAHAAAAQVPAAELEPLLHELAHPPHALEERVPLMTDDKVVAPLFSVQVHSPTNVPVGGTSCTVTVLEHEFGEGSYNTPAVVAYSPPADSKCGKVGQWAAVTMNLTTYAIGTQYDRLAEIYLGHVEIWRSSSAEPTKTGTVWTTVKDVTHYTALLARSNDLMMDFSNIIAPDLLLDAAFQVTVSVTFHAATPAFPAPNTANLIIPLSNMSPTVPNFFTLSTDDGATTNVSLPLNTEEAFVEVYCSGNSAEEFWYANTPDEFVDKFPGTVTGKGPFREVQVLVDGQIAGVAWPMPVLYTGGVTPSNWRPLVSYGAYDQPHYVVDVTPFLPILLSNVTSTPHNITLRVKGQGLDGASFNSNWYVSGSVHVSLGSGPTSGKIVKYDVGPLQLQTTGGANAGDQEVWTKVAASRSIRIESDLKTGNSVSRRVVFAQELSYSNDAKYEDEGWVQWVTQSTKGKTLSTRDGIVRLTDAFNYPFEMLGNYSLYEQKYGGYGSSINQSHSRTFSTPFEPYILTHSKQQAEGWINMDDWPGLRHAINGTGSTAMSFAYTDARLGTYYRDIAAKNDGWVRDKVWGTLAQRLPALPKWQISGPDGGQGFKRAISRRVVSRLKP